MPATYQTRFTCARLEPYINPEHAFMISVRMAPSINLALGTVLGVITTKAYAKQTLTITGTPTGGTFKITFRGYETAAIAYNATAANVKSALEALPVIPVGTITATGGALPGTPVALEFRGDMGYEPIELMVVSTKALTGGTTPDAAIASTTTGVAPLTCAAYVDGNSDGTEVAKFLLPYAITTDAAGMITLSGVSGQDGGEWGQRLQTIAVYYSGVFKTLDLVGLDANGVTDLGRLIQGTYSDGILVVG